MISQKERIDDGGGDSSLTSKSTNASSRSLPTTVVEYDENNQLFMGTLTRVVNETIFPKKQFIILEEEMDVRGRLAHKCLQELKIENAKWNSIKEVVRKRLTQKRNNVMSSIKKSLTSK